MLSLSLQCLSLPRISPMSSRRFKYLVRTSTISTCTSSLIIFSQTRTLDAQHIHTRLSTRTLRTSQRYGSLRRPYSRATLSAWQSGIKLWVAFWTSHIRTSSMEAPSTRRKVQQMILTVVSDLSLCNFRERRRGASRATGPRVSSVSWGDQSTPLTAGSSF